MAHLLQRDARHAQRCVHVGGGEGDGGGVQLVVGLAQGLEQGRRGRGREALLRGVDMHYYIVWAFVGLAQGLRRAGGETKSY